MVKINRHKHRFRLMLLILLILAIMLVYLAVAGLFLYKKNFGNDSLFRYEQDLLGAKYLYNLYVSKIPDIDSRPFYGSPNASITIIAYLDINSKSTKFFIDEIFPKLKEEFINTGKLRYYQKSYITEEDYRKKTDKFIYAKSLLCISKINKDEYYPFYFDLIENASKFIFYVGEHNLSKELLADCIVNQEFDEIINDILEIKTFGMQGIKQRFYIGRDGKDNQIFNGVPSYARLQRSIWRHLFELGDST